MTVVFCIAVVLDGEHRNLVFAVTGHDSGSLLVGRRIDAEPELEQESLELRGVHLKKINVSKKARRLLLCLHFWSQAIYETYHMKTCDSLGLAGGLTERHSMTTCVLIGDPLHQLPLLVLVRDKNRRVRTGAGPAHEFSTCNVISVRMHEVQRQLSGTSNGLAIQLLQSKASSFHGKESSQDNVFVLVDNEDNKHCGVCHRWQEFESDRGAALYPKISLRTRTTYSREMGMAYQLTRPSSR